MNAIVDRYAVIVVGTVLTTIFAWLTRKILKALERHEQTRVKANLCFQDLCDRRPEMQDAYIALIGNGEAARLRGAKEATQ